MTRLLHVLVLLNEAVAISTTWHSWYIVANGNVSGGSLIAKGVQFLNCWSNKESDSIGFQCLGKDFIFCQGSIARMNSF